MCARDSSGAIEICLSEKGALAKKRLGKTGIYYTLRHSLTETHYQDRFNPASHVNK